MQGSDLKIISNDHLLFHLEELVRSEGNTTVQIAQHLAEVEERRLHAAAGYPSLYEYAVKRLGYSKSSAARRIRLARVGRKLPEVYSYLERGEVTLTGIDTCAEELLSEKGEMILERLRGMSRSEIERVFRQVKLVSPVLLRERIEPVKVLHFKTTRSW